MFVTEHAAEECLGQRGHVVEQVSERFALGVHPQEQIESAGPSQGHGPAVVFRVMLDIPASPDP